MAAGRVVLSAYDPARDRTDRLVAGARLYVYENRTTNLAAVYSDSALTTPLANPVIANSSGRFPTIWVDRGTDADPTLYRLSVTGANGESIGNPSVFDDYSPSAELDAAAYAAQARTAQLATEAAKEDALDAATAADADADAAAASAAAAETARLAAVVAASSAAATLSDVDAAAAALFYDDTTAGLAGTTSGEYFKTFASDRIVTYKNDGGVAVLKSTAPKKADVDSVIARTSPFVLSPVGLDTERVREIALSSNDPDALYAESLFVRYVTRNTSSTFYLTINRTSDNSEVASVGLNGTAIDPTGYTGVVKLPLLASLGSGITGSVWVDFGDGSTFGALTPFDPADTTLDMDRCVFANPDRKGDIEGIVERLSVSKVFPASADAYFRALVQDARIEGGDENHTYILNATTVLIPGTPNTYRVQFFIKDITDNIEVARWTRDSSTDDFATLPETIFLCQAVGGQPNDVALGTTYTGITATFWLDWSALVWNYSLSTYTTYAESGFLPGLVHTKERMDEFLRRAEPKIRLTVGAGTPTATHFNTIQSAVESLYISGLTITRSSYPCSDICTFSNQVLVEVIDADHAEDLGTGGTGNEGLLIPPYMTLRLRHDTLLERTGNSTGLPPVLETPFSCRIEGYGRIRQNGRGYVIHADNENGFSKPASAGPEVQRYFIRRNFNARLEAGSASQEWIIGAGIAQGEVTIIENSRLVREGTSTAAFHGIHTSPDALIPGRIIWRNSSANDADVSGSNGAIGLLKSHTQTALNEVIVENCDIGAVTAGNTAGGNAGFVRIGGKSGATWTASLDPA